MLAARRFGIKTVVIPALNEPDLLELPAEIRREMTFVPAETLEQVIAVAMPPGGTGDTKPVAQEQAAGR
jgi:ATP-dependent Lon protease